MQSARHMCSVTDTPNKMQDGSQCRICCDRVQADINLLTRQLAAAFIRPSPVNNMTNNTEESEIIYYDEETSDSDHHMLHDYILPVLYSVTCVTGLVGNLLIIIIYAFYEKMRTLTDTFMVNLAMADIFFLCTLPFLAYQVAQGWIFGEVMCKITRVVYRINLYCSMLLLTCITFDRFISITQAKKFNMYHSKKHSLGKLVCMIVWLVSLLLAVPQFKYSVTSNENCFEVYDPPHLEVMVNSFQITVGVFLPLAAMIFCYTFIIKKLIFASNYQKHKSIKIIFMVVMAFIATQLPYNIGILCHVVYKTFDKTFMLITEAIAYMHACLNPILYFFVGVKFRKNFWKILEDLRLAKPNMELSDNLKTTDRESKSISVYNNTEAISMNQL
ncbi:C-X-C chemokine receptor type 6 [Xenopus laevis]|uniref:C-X-C chemokine receptor type 6 n=4 Tax=Xenopus laevis TaxID=8355 RepID=A0A8J1KXT8_XENLA|nr:C-X-C chemokine receptor type 6 [Xenopus laevis]